jgi:serine/threonine-protein kinase HipA
MRADMSDSVENEWVCARLMAQLGFDVAHTEMATFGRTRALVVTRFDRRWQGIPPGAQANARFKPPQDAWIARLPQEDFCQASGIGPDNKYQSDGGPSMADCLKVLLGSEHPDQDRATFVLAQLAFWLLAATDGHAKNFSIRHRRGGLFRLTPLYDVLSAWPIIGDAANKLPYERARLAMAVKGKNMHYRLREVQPRHWQRLAAACGEGVWDRMQQLVAGAEAALNAVENELPKGFPGRTWTAIRAGVRRHARAFTKARSVAEAD